MAYEIETILVDGVNVNKANLRDYTAKREKALVLTSNVGTEGYTGTGRADAALEIQGTDGNNAVLSLVNMANPATADSTVECGFAMSGYHSGGSINKWTSISALPRNSSNVNGWYALRLAACNNPDGNVDMALVLEGAHGVSMFPSSSFGDSPGDKVFQIRGYEQIKYNGLTVSGNFSSVAQFENSAATKGLLFGHDSGGVIGVLSSSRASSQLAFWTHNGSAWGERARFDGGGDLAVGSAGGIGVHILARTASAAAGDGVLRIYGGTANNSGLHHAFREGDVSTWNAAACCYNVGSVASTSRSINASGTINASGGDFAEYEVLEDAAIAFKKGDIVGFNGDGKLTDKWSRAVSGFATKSTDPSFVGKDTYDADVGAPPERPRAPEAIGDDEAGPEPQPPGAAPRAPAAPLFAVDLSPLEFDELKRRYAALLASLPERQREHAQQVRRYQEQHAEWELNRKQDAARRLAYDAAVAAHAKAMPAYEAALAEWEVQHEAARRMVDRIAKCGDCPVNVTGAKPGQYVAAMEGPNDSIAGAPVDSMAGYEGRIVGRVRRILEDGRAEIAVIVQ